MTWRIVVVESKARLSYKNDYLVIRNEKIKMIHLSEISTLIIDSTAVSLTSYLLSEMMKRKIKIIICDEKRNPQGEIVPYYGCHNSSQMISKQLHWSDYANNVWTEIIKEKIKNQARHLKLLKIENYSKLEVYADEVQELDSTNREGHAAKVYFNSLFGMNFNRDGGDAINAALNYGYTILLSQFNKAIVSNGYLTQLGIKHSNYFNHFNLSSDLMEPFRPLVDCIVKKNENSPFDSQFKLNLVDVLNQKVTIKNKQQFVSNAIDIYVKSVFEAIEKKNLDLIEFFEYEL